MKNVLLLALIVLAGCSDPDRDPDPVTPPPSKPSLALTEFELKQGVYSIAFETPNQGNLYYYFTKPSDPYWWTQDYFEPWRLDKAAEYIATPHAGYTADVLFDVSQKRIPVPAAYVPQVSESFKICAVLKTDQGVISDRECLDFSMDTVVSKDPPPPVYYTVDFNKNNSDSGSTDANPPTATVAAGNPVNPPPAPPTRPGYAFTGWVDGSGAAFTAATPVTANITVYAQWDGPGFQFTVRTTTPNESFAIPTSGSLNDVATAKPYDWHIYWGDTQDQTANGSSSLPSAGISHTYSTAGDHQITIMPGGSTDAWLGAFGFADSTAGWDAISGSNAFSNRNKVVSVDSELTLLMTRTAAQISAGTAPTYEWASTFCYCTNPAFIMGPNFKFAPGWDSITTVGDYFAYRMFAYCLGSSFTMNAVFNLPPNITTVGNDFALLMFDDCRGSSFTMNAVFNLPQKITTVGKGFVRRIFGDCSGPAFQVNGIFKFPLLSLTEVDKTDVFFHALFLGTSIVNQTRTAASIINGNPIPSVNKSTFGSFRVWKDYGSIPPEWQG